MDNPLVAMLENFARLSRDDRAALDRLASERVRQVAAAETIIEEGRAPRSLILFLKGWACRHKDLDDGRRQIVSFLLPGDLCDLNIFILRQTDHSVASLTPVTLAEITRERLEEVTLAHPRITQALLWQTLLTAATHREWIVNLGQRDAAERMAHLLCELFLRLRAVGLTDGDSCHVPLVQTTLGEATGLSQVHVNRTLARLRERGLLTLQKRTLTVPDLEALMEVAQFDPNYLHLGREGRHLDANA